MKKFTKGLLFGAAIGAVAAGAYYVMKKNNTDRFDDDDFDDFDDFDDDDDYENGTESVERTYVPLNLSTSDAEDIEPFDEEDTEPMADTVEDGTDEEVADDAVETETIEEFFDEEESDK
nr:hypothetical protein [Lachnospiraceae bacterium]